MGICGCGGVVSCGAVCVWLGLWIACVHSVCVTPRGACVGCTSGGHFLPECVCPGLAVVPPGCRPSEASRPGDDLFLLHLLHLLLWVGAFRLVCFVPLVCSFAAWWGVVAVFYLFYLFINVCCQSVMRASLVFCGAGFVMMLAHACARLRVNACACSGACVCVCVCYCS